MQIIIPWKTGVAEYAAQELHRTVCASESCPQCGKAGCLEAHGYYQRWVSEEDNGKAVRISVRRFLPAVRSHGELPAGLRTALSDRGHGDH